MKLDQKIEIALKMIYEKQEIVADIGCKEVKDIQQSDEVAMGSIHPVLASITMAELRKCIVHRLKYLCF